MTSNFNNPPNHITGTTHAAEPSTPPKDPKPVAETTEPKAEPKVEPKASKEEGAAKPETKPTPAPTSSNPVKAPVTATVPPKPVTPSSLAKPPHSPTSHMARPTTDDGHPLYQWWVDLWNKLWPTESIPSMSPFTAVDPSKGGGSAKDDAKNRLRLVLLHDRSQLSPQHIEAMRDELVTVISKYVEIDKKSLDLYLEQEADTIALVANLSVVRRKESKTS